MLIYYYYKLPNLKYKNGNDVKFATKSTFTNALDGIPKPGNSKSMKVAYFQTV